MTVVKYGSTLEESPAPLTGRSPAARPAARTMARELMVAGCTPPEAANLVALTFGLAPVASGWTLQQIERLRFLQHLARRGAFEA